MLFQCLAYDTFFQRHQLPRRTIFCFSLCQSSYFFAVEIDDSEVHREEDGGEGPEDEGRRSGGGREGGRRSAGVGAEALEPVDRADLGLDTEPALRRPRDLLGRHCSGHLLPAGLPQSNRPAEGNTHQKQSSRKLLTFCSSSTVYIYCRRIFRVWGSPGRASRDREREEESRRDGAELGGLQEDGIHPVCKLPPPLQNELFCFQLSFCCSFLKFQEGLRNSIGKIIITT